jgi:hypothetical protein
MLLMELSLENSPQPQPLDGTGPKGLKEMSVVIACGSSSSVEMYSWQNLPFPLSIIGEKAQDMMSLTTNF